MSSVYCSTVLDSTSVYHCVHYRFYVATWEQKAVENADKQGKQVYSRLRTDEKKCQMPSSSASSASQKSISVGHGTKNLPVAAAAVATTLIIVDYLIAASLGHVPWWFPDITHCARYGVFK